MASLADSATFWSLLVFKSPVLFKKSVSDNVDLIFYPSLSSGLRSLQCRNLVCPLAPSLLPLKHSSHLRVMQESKRRDYSGHCSSSDNTLRGGGGEAKAQSLWGHMVVLFAWAPDTFPKAQIPDEGDLAPDSRLLPISDLATTRDPAHNLFLLGGVPSTGYQPLEWDTWKTAYPPLPLQSPCPLPRKKVEDQHTLLLNTCPTTMGNYLEICQWKLQGILI